MAPMAFVGFSNNNMEKVINIHICQSQTVQTNSADNHHRVTVVLQSTCIAYISAVCTDIFRV